MQKNDNTLKIIKGQYENVATALYLVTNHLKDTEPLKNRVREISHDILEQMIHLSDISYVHVENHTSHLQSLLKIASSAGLIAEQNAMILSNALQKTLKDMQHYMKSLTNMSISLSDLLYIEPSAEVIEDVLRPEASHPVPQRPASHADHAAHASNVQAKETRPAQPKHISAPASQPAPMASQKMSFNNVASMRQAFSDMNKSAAVQGDHQGQQGQSSSDAPGRLTDRQQIIIKELRNKGQLTVKDLADKIKGCSEKTIQRELLALVGSGVLKKEGERRWSRYSLQ